MEQNQNETDFLNVSAFRLFVLISIWPGDENQKNKCILNRLIAQVFYLVQVSSV